MNHLPACCTPELLEEFPLLLIIRWLPLRPIHILQLPFLDLHVQVAELLLDELLLRYQILSHASEAVDSVVNGNFLGFLGLLYTIITVLALVIPHMEHI